MDLYEYIESGIIESYLLGLASPEEIAQLERMRLSFPELNVEIATMEYKLQKIMEEGGMTPPAQVWNHIAKRLTWEQSSSWQPPKQETGHKGFTYIIQPGNNTITINIWWRCAFVAVCVLLMALMASTIYFYQRYHEMENRLLRLYPAMISSPPASHK